MQLRHIGITALILLTGCATPPQVKQLSVKQIDYFDAAIEAVSLQAEALILASEKLVDQSKIRIAEMQAENRRNLETLMLSGTLDEETAGEITKRLETTASEAEKSRGKLDQDLELIKQKSDELQEYLKKMKDVHVALDAYIQSEKAGEAVVNNILNQPSVTSLLNKVTELTPKINNGVKDINSLLTGIK